MELTHIEHLGIAVKSIEACLPYYEEVLGLKCYNIEEVASTTLHLLFPTYRQHWTKPNQKVSS